MRLAVAKVEGESAHWDGQPEFTPFVAFPAQRQEARVLSRDEGQQWPGHGLQRRRLVEAAVKSAEDPVELWYSHGRANPRVRTILRYASRKMRHSESAVYCEPVRHAELFLRERGEEAALGAGDLR